MKGSNGSVPPASRSPESFVKDAACDVGFSVAGIAGVSPSSRSGAAFDRWIGEGKHADMRYLSGGAGKRKDPALLLEGARSVVCVGLNYYSRAKEKWNREGPTGGRGEVAMYAHGPDYHGVVTEMLGALEDRLRRVFHGLNARAVVDTEPISERDFALRAGIGWLGKNTCVFSPGFGSWLFLGELLTNLSLEPDSPLETLCGTCTRCIDSCPTGALEEFSLDANKCISYLTIEKRGEIPAGFHRAIGERLFGCDECQKVCPFNEAARESIVFEGRMRNRIVEARVDDLLGLADEELRSLARGTAMARCKPDDLRRNAGIVAKNRRSNRAEDTQ